MRMTKLLPGAQSGLSEMGASEAWPVILDSEAEAGSFFLQPPHESAKQTASSERARVDSVFMVNAQSVPVQARARD
jgi:hypothetical protein